MIRWHQGQRRRQRHEPAKGEGGESATSESMV
jgi:hypothetical protein